MALPTQGWQNKNGTKDRSCLCGSWQTHWVKFAKKAWPQHCAVSGCLNEAELGAHVFNSQHSGEYEYIVPMCASCNGRDGTFYVDEGITIPSANKSETCG